MHGLPDVSSETPTEEDLIEYARRTWVKTEWLINREPSERHARSFFGLPVEVKGSPWGVIVIDSSREQPIGDGVLEGYTTMARVLAKLLERVGR